MSRFSRPCVLALLASCLAVAAAQDGELPHPNSQPTTLTSYYSGTPYPTSLSQTPLQILAPAETPGPAQFGNHGRRAARDAAELGDFLLLDDAPPSGVVNINIHAAKQTSPAPSNSDPTKASSTPKATALPTPFDNTPSSAFRADGADNTCPNFITSLLANPTFKSCYPLSMMLQTSSSFFAAERSLPTITRVLDATCAADPAPCAAFLDEAANNISSTACTREMQKNQALVVQAYRGLKAYSVLYAATCLQDPNSTQYCFATAVTDTSAPADSYLYFLPYGLAMPAGSAPSCGWCTQQTMAMYHAAAAEGQVFVGSTYNGAAGQINAACGSDFVNDSAPVATTSAGTPIASPGSAAASLALLLASLAAPLLLTL
ncbi:hypothetical protein ESCO_005995 [Escovopsis weberi]|uniref:DUF7729 domain-containing protein n=1 Tax=Escovopsis weberi TaxID=150374 RepID=A0A0M9VRZ9_ESCWE|nr:hypothetical protein ESCO_005995 [Escovopsis weberi]